MTETSYTSLRQNLAAVLDRVAEGRKIEFTQEHRLVYRVIRNGIDSLQAR